MINNTTCGILRATLIIRIVNKESLKKPNTGEKISFEITAKVHAIANSEWKRYFMKIRG
jgi:hypothetical protein